MLSVEVKFVKISAIFFSLACVAEVILLRLYIFFPPSFARTFSSRERRLGTRQNGLNEIPKVRFQFLHLDRPIDNGFLTGQSWRLPKSWYTVGGGGEGGGNRTMLSAPFRRRS